MIQRVGALKPLELGPEGIQEMLRGWAKRGTFEERYSWLGEGRGDRDSDEDSSRSASSRPGSRPALDLEVGRRVEVRVSASEADDASTAREALVLVELDPTQLPSVIDQGLTASGRVFFALNQRGTLLIPRGARGTLQGLLQAAEFLRGLAEAEASGVTRSPSPTLGVELSDGSLELSLEHWGSATPVHSQADLGSSHAALRAVLLLVLEGQEHRDLPAAEELALASIRNIVADEQVGSSGEMLDRLVSASRFERQAYRGQRWRALMGRSPTLVRIALGLVAMAMLAGIAAWVATQRKEALTQRADLLGVHVDVRLLEDRYEQLWSDVTPDLSVLQEFLTAAEVLLAQGPEIRAALAELAERGQPTGRVAPAVETELATRRSELAQARAGLEIVREIDGGESERIDRFVLRTENLGRLVKGLEADVAAMQERLFDAPADGWEYDQLRESLRALNRVGSLEYGWLRASSLPDRMSLARLMEALEDQPSSHGDRVLRRASWTEFEAWLQLQDASWDRVRRDLRPQSDLVFLGPDAVSGYPEFLHVPAHLGEWRPADVPEEPGKALILVLLPGGPAVSGEQSTDPGLARHVDHVAVGVNGEMGALATVDLAPFFVSKYEVSQSQWLAWAGSNPSSHHEDMGATVTLLHPVDGISARKARGVLRSFGLQVPSEAQWEYAARAGSQAQWPWGDTEQSLSGKANIAWAPESEPGRGDVYSSHGPVGSFDPNAFGLHDVIGNVKECCAWTGLEYWAPLRDPDVGIRIGTPRFSVTYRGGSALDRFMTAKCAGPRRSETDDSESDMGGVRPVRTIRAAAVSAPGSKAQ